MAFTLHCTRKLLERVKPSAVSPSGTASTRLGNWYATALFWKPQIALVVNEHTLLPVLMPLAPAANLASRFPHYVEQVLLAHGMPASYVNNELMQMNEVQFAKTSNRSVVGIMNQFSYQAEVYRDYHQMEDLLMLSVRLSQTPCSPLYKSAISPDRALRQLMNDSAIKIND